MTAACRPRRSKRAHLLYGGAPRRAPGPEEPESRERNGELHLFNQATRCGSDGLPRPGAGCPSHPHLITHGGQVAGLAGAASGQPHHRATMGSCHRTPLNSASSTPGCTPRCSPPPLVGDFTSPTSCLDEVRRSPPQWQGPAAGPAPLLLMHAPASPHHHPARSAGYAVRLE